MQEEIVNFIFLWILHMMKYCQMSPIEAIEAVIKAANDIIRLHNETDGKFSTYSSGMHYSDNQVIFSSLLDKSIKYTKINDHTVRQLRFFANEPESYSGEFSGFKK